MHYTGRSVCTVIYVVYSILEDNTAKHAVHTDKEFFLEKRHAECRPLPSKRADYIESKMLRNPDTNETYIFRFLQFLVF